MVKLATDPIIAQIGALREDIVRWGITDRDAVAALRDEFESCRGASQNFRREENLAAAQRRGQWAAVWAIARIVRSEWRTLGLMAGWAVTTAALLLAARP